MTDLWSSLLLRNNYVFNMFVEWNNKTCFNTWKYGLKKHIICFEIKHLFSAHYSLKNFTFNIFYCQPNTDNGSNTKN